MQKLGPINVVWAFQTVNYALWLDENRAVYR